MSDDFGVMPDKHTLHWHETTRRLLGYFKPRPERKVYVRRLHPINGAVQVCIAI